MCRLDDASALASTSNRVKVHLQGTGKLPSEVVVPIVIRRSLPAFGTRSQKLGLTDETDLLHGSCLARGMSSSRSVQVPIYR